MNITPKRTLLLTNLIIVLLLALAPVVLAQGPYTITIGAIDAGATLTVNGSAAAESDTFPFAEGTTVTFVTTFGGQTYEDVIELHYDIEVKVHAKTYATHPGATINLDTDLSYSPYDIFVITSDDATEFVFGMTTPPTSAPVQIIGFHAMVPTATLNTLGSTSHSGTPAEFAEIFYGTVENNSQLNIATTCSASMGSAFNKIVAKNVEFANTCSNATDIMVQELYADYAETADTEISWWRMALTDQFYVDDYDGYSLNDELPEQASLTDDGMLWFKAKNPTKWALYPLVEISGVNQSWRFDNRTHNDYNFWETDLGGDLYWFNDNANPEYAHFLGPVMRMDSFDWTYNNQKLNLNFFGDSSTNNAAAARFDGDSGTAGADFWSPLLTSSYGYTNTNGDIVSPVFVLKLRDGDFRTEDGSGANGTDLHLGDNQDLLILSDSSYLDFNLADGGSFYQGTNAHWVVEDGLTYNNDTPTDSAFTIDLKTFELDGLDLTIKAENGYDTNTVDNTTMYLAYRKIGDFGQQLTKVPMEFKRIAPLNPFNKSKHWVLNTTLPEIAAYNFYIVATENDSIYGKVIEINGPEARNDAVSTLEETPLTIDPLTNDYDPGDTLHISTVSSPAHGTATLSSATQIVYTPTLNFAGTDSFTYTASDDNLTGVATVTVTVNNVNDAPQVIGEGDITFLTKWGSEGSGEGQLNSPHSVAVDSSGNIYVVENANHRIQKFDSSGSFVAAWGWGVQDGSSEYQICTNNCQAGTQGSGDGQFKYAKGVVVDSSGNVYVVDTSNYRIQKFDSSGSFVAAWGWGVQDGSSEYQICTSNCQAGTQGSGDGQFKTPYSAAVDSGGNVYVVDTYNHRIQKFDSSGSFVAAWGWGVQDGSSEYQICTSNCQAGISGSGEGQFNSPASDAVVDSWGNVYVVSYVNSRIQKFDSSGSFVAAWGWGVQDGSSEYQICTSNCQAGISGSGDGQFKTPYGVAVGSGGNVYVTDYGNKRIQEFTGDGTFLTKSGSGGSGDGQFSKPYGVTVDRSGNLYVVDEWYDRIQKFVDTIHPISETAVIMSEDGDPTPFDLTLTADDPDPGDTLTWSIVTQPLSGTAVTGGTGITQTIAYTPTENFYGNDSFVVRVSDGGLSDTVTVRVTVEAVNDPPDTVDDTITTTEEVGVTISPLTNDSDPENDPFTLGEIGNPANGTAVISGTQIVYNPALNFAGSDVFTYSVGDSSLTGTATITVTVNNTPDSPSIAESQAEWVQVGSAGFSPGVINYTSLALDSSGTPYVAYRDNANSFKVSAMKFNGSSWEQVGSAGFSAGTNELSLISLALDNSDTPYVAYTDGGNGDRASVMKYNGSSWEQVGNAGFSPGIVSDISLAFDGNGVPYVAFKDGGNSNKASAMKFNGSSWVQVGSAGFSPGIVSNISLTLDGNGVLYVAYSEAANSSVASVMKYNGSSWVQVGSAGFSPGGSNYINLAIDGSDTPYVAYRDYDNSYKASVMKYNGSSWVQVGNAGFSPGMANDMSLALDDSGTPYVAYSDGANSNKASVMKYNGSGWVQVGNAGFSPGGTWHTSLAFDSGGILFLAYGDEGNNNKASVMRSDLTQVNVMMSEDGNPTPFDLTLTADDPDPGDTLTWSIVTQPLSGTAVTGGTGITQTIAYTPTENFYGNDSFVVRVSDGGLSDTVTVSVTVESVSDAPAAVDDSQTTTLNTPVTIKPLENDSDAENDTLSILAVGVPFSGTATLNGVTQIVYTPTLNFVGTDSFSYTISDGALTDTATITVTVSPDNASPGIVLNKTVAPARDVSSQQLATYTLVLRNNGRGDDPAVTLTDTLPGAVDFAGWITQAGAAVTNDEITWDGSVSAGQTITISFAVTNTAGSGTVTNTATFSGAAQTGSDTAVYTAATTVAVCRPSLTSGNWSILFSGCAPGQKIIIPAGYTVVLDQNINLDVDLEVEPGGTLDATTKRKTVTLTGSGNQTLTGDFTFYRMTVNKDSSTDTVTIDGSLAVKSKLRVRTGELISASDYEDVEIEADGTLRLTNVISVSGHFTNSGTLTTNGWGTVFNGAKTQNLVLNTYTEFDDVTVLTGTTLVEAVTDDNSYVNGTLTNYGTIRKTQPVAFEDFYYFGMAGAYPDYDAWGMELEVTDLTGSDPLTAIQVDRIDKRHPNAPAQATDIYWTITPTGTDFIASVTLPHNNVTEPLACRYTSSAWDCANDDSDTDYVTYLDTTTFSDWAVFEAQLSAVDDPNESTDEDMLLTINPLVNDSGVGSSSLSLNSVGSPAHGTATISGTTQIVYTPTLNYNGTDSFTYQATNGDNQDSAIITVTITAVNDNPVANGDSLTTQENQAKSVDVLANDTDAENGTLSIVDLTQPLSGTAAISGSVVLYRPQSDYSGPDSFGYTVSDGQGGAAQGAVTVTVQTVNHPPEAITDSVTFDEDTVVVLSVLTNDSDSDNDTLSLNSVGSPAHGTATISGTTQIVYTPTLNYNGADSFTYIVSDGQGGIDSAQVQLTISPVTDAPAAIDDAFDTAQNVPITVSPTTNDLDPDNTGLCVVDVGAAQYGTATRLNCTVVYTPTTSFTGFDSFTYTLQSDAPASAHGNVTMIVAQPKVVATTADTGTTAEDTDLALSVLDNDTDSGALKLAAVSQPINGQVVISGSAVKYSPDTNFNGTDTFSYTVTDTNGWGQALVTVTVTPVNDNPAAIKDVTSTDEETAVEIDLLVNDTDVDIGQTLTVTAVSDALNGAVVVKGGGVVTYTPKTDFVGSDSFTYTLGDGAGGSSQGLTEVTVRNVNDAPKAAADVIRLDEDGSRSFNPLENDWDADKDTLTLAAIGQPANGDVTGSGPITYTPDTNFAGIDSFTYTVSDGVLSDTTTVTVTVSAVNDAPVITDSTPVSVTMSEDGSPVAFNLTLHASDPDSGDTLAWTVATQPLSGTASANGSGSSKVISYTPPANWHGTTVFTVAVSDGTLSDTMATSVTVKAVNDAPVAVDDAVSTYESSPLIISPLINDTDIDGGSLILLSAMLGSPSHGTATVSGTTQVVYTPTLSYSGKDSFTYTVSDGSLTDFGIITVTINSVNDAPVITDSQPISVTMSEDGSPNPFDLTLHANDADPGDTLTWSIAIQPVSGTATAGGTGITQTIGYTPPADWYGSTVFTVAVSDGTLNDTVAVSVTVNAVNDAPVITDSQPISVTMSEDGSPNPFDLTLHANDADPGDTLTWSIATQPLSGTAMASGSGGSKAIGYTPPANWYGSTVFTVAVSDGTLNDTVAVSVTVEPVNDAPVAVDDPNESTSEDTPLTISPLTNDSDTENDTLSISAISSLGHGTASISGTAQVVYTPTLNFVGTDVFTYTASDGSLTDTATITVTVKNANDAPVITDSTPISVTMSEDGSPNPFDLTLHANDANPGDTLSWSIATQPLSGTATASGTGGSKAIGYTPPANWNGSTVFAVAVSDGTLSDTVAVSVTVEAVNDAPVAVYDDLSTGEDVPLTISPLTNDTDADGDSLNLVTALLGSPSHGKASISGTTQVVYTPTHNYHGTDSFLYTVSDGQLINFGTITVTVNSVNDAPLAVDDTELVRRDDNGGLSILGTDPVTIPVLLNDSDPSDGVNDSSGLTVSAVDPLGSQGGGVAINSNKLWVDYTPNGAFTGTEVLSYTVQDSGGLTDTATVTVTVVNGDGGGSTEPDDAGGETIIIANTGLSGAITVTLQLPPGVATDTLALLYNEQSTPSGEMPQGYMLAGLLFNLDAYLNQVVQPGYVFSTPITLTVAYSDEDVADIPQGEDGLELRYWNGSEWSDDGITVVEHDKDNNRLTVTIAHLSEFALLGRDLNLYYLPLIAKNFISAPDLIITDLSATGSSITVKLKNQGNAPVTEDFWVDVYFNPTGTPDVNKPWQNIAPAGATWGVTVDIPASDTLTLTVGDAYYASQYSSSSFPAGAQLFGYVDSVDFTTSYGAVQESDESNNLFGAVTSSAGSGAAPLSSQGDGPELADLPQR